MKQSQQKSLQSGNGFLHRALQEFLASKALVVVIDDEQRILDVILRPVEEVFALYLLKQEVKRG